MSNAVVESLFLLAFFAPPLAVVASVPLLIARRPDRREAIGPAHVAPAHR